MSAHFKWYPDGDAEIVPWNARYSYPSQANKAVKMTPRIPPKNGAEFTPVEFPAQGYVNPLNTTIEFDVELTGPTFDSSTTDAFTRFENNIQSIFSRVRLLYGSTPLEDIIKYNTIVRNLTEWTGTNQENALDQTSITDGIGGSFSTFVTTSGGPVVGTLNARQAYIQGIDDRVPVSGSNSLGAVPNGIVATSSGTVAGKSVRRYQVSLALGLFTQDKLIPTKYMASQLAIEITLENPASCIISRANTGRTLTTKPTYKVLNVNLIPEVLTFDSSYDEMFLMGLKNGGVPIKFASWHTFLFNTAGASNINLQIQERSRSVKAIFCVQKRNPADFPYDSGASFFSTGGTLQNFQFRIANRYYPAAPVQCSTTVGSAVSNGGAEAYIELQKSLSIVGDYRLSTPCNSNRWGLAGLLESDYQDYIQYFNLDGTPVLATVGVGANTLVGHASISGGLGSACFAMSTNLETTNGVEISGLNAEEQSDISLLANYSAAQVANFSLEVYTYYDAMIVLRENNVIELIQ